MTNDRYVSTNADIKVSRSRFSMKRRSKFSYFHGYLHPIGSPIEVLPGDTIKAKLSLFTRMSTPIVPFVDDIRQEADVFFVPKRVLFDKTKQFYGEAPSFGIAAKVYEPSIAVVRTITPGTYPTLTNLEKSERIDFALGLINYGSSPNTINVLPIRSIFAIYNEYYRDQNYQDQYTWDKTSTGVLSVPLAYIGGNNVGLDSYLPKVNKDRDVVVSVLPWAQKGNPVSINLTGDVPVLATSNGNHDMLNTITFGYSSGGVNYDTQSGELGIDSGKLVRSSQASVLNYGEINRSNLVARLSSATAVSINDLLYAIAYQDFLARAAHFGTRYKEYIYSMFGTQIPDLTADVPEYLGRLRFNINVQQVVQTTGFDASSNTELGALGAYSNSGGSGDLFTKSFTEPGYIVFLTYTKHQRTYSTGVDRVFLKKELLDYYQPPFANIPDLPFSSDNYWFGDTTNAGFQEPWFDYHALQDRCYGLLNPMVDSLGGLWTLAEKWSAKPTIAGAFMVEDRDAIARVLATGVNGPDYLVDALIELDATRVMPLYSSGRLEHF